MALRPLLLSLAALGLLAAAPASAQTLTIGISATPSSADPHFHNGASTQTLVYQIYDTLFERQPDGSLGPSLAVRWAVLSDTVWEVALRPGVRFTDGVPFTADDVVFSAARAPAVPNATSTYASAVRSIARIEVVDPLTLRFHTDGPAPFLPNDLAPLPIVSRHAGEGATTEDYNSGRAAIGTGPFRMLSYKPGESTELAANPGWWGRRPDWERVSMRYLPNAGTRSAALLSGSVDMIDMPSPNDLPRFKRDANFRVFEHPGTRLVYLAPNQSAEVAPFVTGLDGQPLPANPLRDPRVRQALSVAINRAGLADRVMQGTAIPSGQFIPAGGYSHAPQVPVPAYDPAMARRLLAEAGYPAGFRITLHAASNSRPTDPVAAQAIAQMWTQAGVPTTVETMPLSVYSARSARMDFAVAVWGWASQGHAGHGLVNVVNTADRARLTGAFNRSGYANPELDALTARALSTMADAPREALLQQAVALAMQDGAIIPLYLLTNSWVTRRGIAYRPAAQDYTLAREATLAP